MNKYELKKVNDRVRMAYVMLSSMERTSDGHINSDSFESLEE